MRVIFLKEYEEGHARWHEGDEGNLLAEFARRLAAKGVVRIIDEMPAQKAPAEEEEE